jgi:AcrR family transcriptional regulator
VGTRTRILDAALERFARQGYAGASIRQIAGDVGIQQSAIYNHFPSKQAMLDALVNETGPGPLLELIDAEPGRVTASHPADVLPGMIDHMLRVWEQPRARLFTSVMLREGGPAAVGAPDVIAEAQQRLGEVFARWIDAGLLRDGFPPEHIVYELMAPLAIARMRYLHADADEETRRAGLALARRHVAYFLAREVNRNA